MGCFTPKYPELDQIILEWFAEQRSQGKFFVKHWFCILKQQKQDHEIDQSADCRVNLSWMCDSQNYCSIMWQHCVWKILIDSRRVKFLTFRSFGNLLTSFCIGIAVSGLMLRLKAKEFSEETKTTLAQCLPEDLEQQTVKFHRFVITSRQRHGYSLLRIFIFSVKTH